ncbi:probable protein phosphatase 2C 8 isoform X2 [Henckelia pumila]|uniref:probable protein phosphatase 2C 8 isoform X2 n=1 Tax=Henckelia pumila TaxID=405737 RepID=UPI003C6E1AF8
MAAASKRKANSMSPNRGTDSEIERPNEFDDSDSSTKKAKSLHELQTGSTNDKASSSNAVSEKIDKFEDKYFSIEADAAENKGSRHTMEDAWVVLHDASLESPGNLRCAHFAVYDGHGGRLAADYAQKHLHRNVLSSGLPRELLDVKSAKKAILDGGWQDGATAVCVWVLGQTVFVANIGDAKAVVARTSETDCSKDVMDRSNSLKAIVLTREHKAIYPQERARIQKAGGSVSSNGRLLGRLEVSRAFGDRNFKKVGVVATPDVHSFTLTERDHFIILGCDGLWGVFGPIDAVEFVHKLLKEGLPAAAVSRHLVREAVRERRCKDNCTAIVMIFKKQYLISPNISSGLRVSV